MLNKRFVLDIGRIFREGQVLGVEFVLRRFGRGFFTELSRRLVRCVRVDLFRIGDLKLFWDLSQRRDKLKVDLPSLAEHVGRTIRGQFSFYLAVSILEVVCRDLADRAKVLVLECAVRHFTSEDIAVFVK